MMKFRKKNTLVEAVQWDGSQAAIADIFTLCKVEVDAHRPHLYLFTDSGLRMVGREYWIVRDSDGRITIYHPEQFAVQYDPI